VRFLADENCDFAIVRALRSAGHDVLAVSEFQSRSVDQLLMEMAYREGRILVTEDKDFGWLAFVRHIENPGVILVRFPSSARQSLADSVIHLVRNLGPRLIGTFVVLTPGSARISRVPFSPR
jgi:predicted nuclease of predicted toxin-antitoxin system